MFKNKNLVIDTSVLIGSPESIHEFSDCNVFLTLEILEELDKHKVRKDEVGVAARYVNRYLDGLRLEHSLIKGAQLANGLTIYVVNGGGELCSGLDEPSNDNKIISVAYKLQKEVGNVVVLTNDIAFRVKCDSLDIEAHGYSPNLKAESSSERYSGIREVLVSKSEIDDFYEDGALVLDDEDFEVNECVILTSGQQSALSIASDYDEVSKLKFITEKGFSVEGVQPRSAEQAFALEMLLDPDISMLTITGKAGSGKAQPLDAKVLTPNGWTTMGEITVGSKVMGSDGYPAEVMGVYPQGIKDIYKITFSDGTSTESCGEHLWHTKTQSDRDSHKEGSVKSLSEIINSLRSKGGKKNHSIPITSPLNFENKITKDDIDPYILGFSLCDNNSDMKTDISMLMGGSEIISEFFIPHDYMYSSVENRLSLLRGLMDANGTSSKNGLSNFFSSKSKALAEGVAELVRSLGGKAVINSRFVTYTNKGLKKIGAESFKVYISMGEEFCPFLLKEKADKWKPTRSTNLRKYIDTVELISKKEAQCIYINNKDHLYITDDYIVTHNTLLSIASAMHSVHNRTYDKIIISRPVESTSKDIGFLPGDKFEKMQPWLQPIFDNLNTIYKQRGMSYIESMMQKGILEVEALTYIRGRSLPRTIFIIDEAQNINYKEAKAVITRMGEGSKIILIGDVEQIDSSKLNEVTSGLAAAVEVFKDFSGAAHVTLKRGERSKLATFAAENM